MDLKNVSGCVGKKVLFIHHSTGGNLICEGNLRKEIYMRDSTVELWDHSYNLFPVCTKVLADFTHLKGLSDNQGLYTGTDFNIRLSNNSPKEYADIFSRNRNDPTLNAILGFDVIAFKNCFPTTRIASDKQLEDDIIYYMKIRDTLKKYPEKQWILMTPPPARIQTTTRDNAVRALQLVQVLTSSDFVRGMQNLHIFDYFRLLADDLGMLRKEFQKFLPWDSHPNKRANVETAPLFAECIVRIAKRA